MKTPPEIADYANEFNLLEALKGAFLEDYPFLSVANLENILEKRFWLFTTEVREQILRRHGREKIVYLEDSRGNFQKILFDQEASAATQKIPLYPDLHVVQIKYGKLSLDYLADQIHQHKLSDKHSGHSVPKFSDSVAWQDFGFLGKSPQILNDFYAEIQNMLQCFDPLKTSSDVFTAVLTTDSLADLNPTEFSIHFICSSVCAAHIIQALKPWFKNLTFANVERSKRFYTATETLLTANYITKLRAKDFKERHILDRILQSLTLEPKEILKLH